MQEKLNISDTPHQKDKTMRSQLLEDIHNAREDEWTYYTNDYDQVVFENEGSGIIAKIAYDEDLKMAYALVQHDGDLNTYCLNNYDSFEDMIDFFSEMDLT